MLSVKLFSLCKLRNASNEGVVKKKVQEVGHKVSKEIKSYALTKYVNYVRNYDKILEVRFPRAMKYISLIMYI
jgi:hypothetical protein